MAIKASILLFCLVVGCCRGASQISRAYSFSYDGDGSTRNEVADDEGIVQGSYTYFDDNGIERTVRYLASGATGFEAEGEGIVNVPLLIEQTRARQAVDGVYEPTQEELDSWANADRSYSLSYHAGDSARSEISRADGYVTGSYSYLDAEGVERIVEYEAGPGIGFRVKGEHIHPKIASDSVPSQFDRPNLALSEYTLRSGQFDYEPSNIEKVFNADGSITYSYQALDHSRTETVGPYGEVRGTYTYIGEDGQTHTVEYVGGSGIGFLASGDHISSNVGRLSASALRDHTRTGTAITGTTVSTAGGRFGASGSVGSRLDTTRTETVTGIRGTGGQLGVLGSGGSRFGTTRTETVTGVRGTGGQLGVLGSGGSRLGTTRTETVTEIRGTAGQLGVLGAGGSRLGTTRTEAVTGVRGTTATGGRIGLFGRGGSRVDTTRTETIADVRDGTSTGGGLGVLGTGGSRVDTTRTETITGVRGTAASGGNFGVLGSGASRLGTTRTETVTGIRGTAATGGLLGVLGSGGSDVGTTRTETVTEIRGSGAPTGFRGPIFGGTRGTTRLTGVRGGSAAGETTRVETTRTESLTGRQPVLLPSIVESGSHADGRRVTVTTTTTENRRGEVGTGGTRRVLSGVRRFGTGQQGSLQVLSGNQFGTDSAGRRIVTTSTRRIARPQPLDLASIAHGAGGLAGDQTVTTVRRTFTETGNQLDHQAGSSGPVGPHFINFSTPDGRKHEVNLE